MKTNIMLDDDLVKDALNYSNVTTKKAIIHLALREYVENRKRKNIFDLVGKIEIDKDYDYKKARE